MAVVVRLLAPGETWALRRAVLRGGRPDAVVHAATDDDPATWHLGAVDDLGGVVATSTFFPEPCPERPEVPGAFRLRSMAVAPPVQRQGVGAAVLERALERLAAAGVPLLWANARDSAIGFYRSRVFDVSDRHFVDAETGLAHTVVLRLVR